MNEIDVDMVGLQVAQALLDRRHDASAAAVTPRGHFVVAHPEFGDDADILTTAAECASQRLLRYPHAVGFGGVKASDAAVDRLPDRAGELCLVDSAVSAADFPATKADRRDLEVGLAESPIFHAFPPVSIARRWPPAASRIAAPCRTARAPPRCPALQHRPSGRSRPLRYHAAEG